MPHLNQLHEKYWKKGLAIIGVSDEPVSKIKPYIDQNSVKYLIAAGGAGEYQTRGIPHSWLVSPKGEVVWEGHPGSLNESKIEEHLKGARIFPSFELPEALSKAKKYLDAGLFARGLKELERYAARPKDESVAVAAREAIGEIMSYGKEELQAAIRYGEEGGYHDAVEVLAELERRFKGTPVADEARKTLSAWKEDKQIKLELSAGALVAKATDLKREKKYKEAAALLRRITQSRKFKETQAAQRAEVLLRDIPE